MKKVFSFLIGLYLILPVAQTEAQNNNHSASNTLRIMSYNIRNAKGLDGKTDYQRIADVIDRIAPDVVAIQELDSVTNRSGQADVLGELSDRTLMHRIFAPAISYDGGKYGIGILSKEKPRSTRYIPLPGREEARALLIAEFGNYVFCSTHFSLTEEDQIKTLPILEKELGGIRKPVFLAGDLNAEPESALIAGLRKNFILVNNPKSPTFPADKPKVCIDYIASYKTPDTAYTVLSQYVVNEPIASDHRPIVAEIRFKADAASIFRTQPYLQNPTGNGITVMWNTNVPVHSWVEYGTDKNNLKKQQLIVNGQIISNNYLHKIRLENLEPGVPYYYRVCSKEITLYQAYKKEFGKTAVSDFYTFTLPSAQTKDFTALIFNDLHKQTGTLKQLFEQVKNNPYDFVVFNGDCIDDPKDEPEAIRFLSAMNETVGAARVPVFYLRGNHEIRNAFSIGLKDLFDYVGGKTYGAFSWGDTRFVMLDCGEDKPDDHWVYYNLNDFSGLRQEQVGFLKEELSGKAFKKAKRHVLLHHIPIYGDTDKYNPCFELWSPLLAKAPFDVAVNAHMHRFSYLPKKSPTGNNFPVVIGGGYSLKDATVMVLQKKGNNMSLKVLNAEGNTILDLKL